MLQLQSNMKEVRELGHNKEEVFCFLNLLQIDELY